jgi:rhodanese-related sulfurtransferase
MDTKVACRVEIFALALVAHVAWAATPAHASAQHALVELENRISQGHPSVRSILPEQLEALRARRGKVLLLDARKEDEFAVSRIPGALRVDPHIGANNFMTKFGVKAKGRLVVLYCSVGVRSSRLARRVDAALRAAGSLGAVNLRGGIFSWHNTGRTIHELNAKTEYIHPYNRSWSRYLEFDNYSKFRKAEN